MAFKHRAIAACLEALTFVSLLIGAQNVCADDYTRLNLPMPIEIESQQVHAPIYLGLDIRMIHLPFDRFSAASTDPAEKLFVTAIKAAQSGDGAQFAKVWVAPNEMKSAGTTTIAMSDDNGPDAWMKMIRSNLDFNHFEIVAEARVGSGRIFIFDSQIQGQPLRSAFYVDSDRKGQSKVTAVSSSTTIPELILEIFQAARTQPQLYAPIAAVHTAYQISLPVEIAGQADTGSVVLEFNGSPQVSTPIKELFQQVNEAYKKGESKTVENFFTTGSQRRVNPWLARDATNNSVRAASLVPPAEHIQFVLEAEPIYIVFTAPPPGPRVPAGWSYQFVIHENGAYKLANYSYSDTLDDLLQNKELFTKEHLRKVP